MFRSLIPVLFVIGCGSDITLVPQPDAKTVTNTVTTTVTNTITNTVTNTTTVTVPSEDPSSEEIECGWIVPSNGAFGTDVYVESIPTFTLVNATTADAVNHYQGEDAVFTFAVEASSCGTIEVLDIFMVVQDVDGNEWLYSVHESGTGSVLTNIAGTFVIPLNSVIAQNMSVTPLGDELHYEWCWDGQGSATCGGVLSQPTINRGSQEQFEFRFTSTHLTPIGEDYEIYVAWIVWRDVTTGEVITDYTTYSTLNRPVHCQ